MNALIEKNFPRIASSQLYVHSTGFSARNTQNPRDLRRGRGRTARVMVDPPVRRKPRSQLQFVLVAE